MKRLLVLQHLEIEGPGLFEQLAKEKDLKKLDPFGKRFSYVEIESANHGFMCEERDSFDKASTLISWNLLMKEFN